MYKNSQKPTIKYSIRETFTSFKDLEIIAISVNVNIRTLAYIQAVREGMFTLTHFAIISRSLKLVNVSLIAHFIILYFIRCAVTKICGSHIVLKNATFFVTLRHIKIKN